MPGSRLLKAGHNGIEQMRDFTARNPEWTFAFIVYNDSGIEIKIQKKGADI
jgi:hypothetical protein